MIKYYLYVALWLVDSILNAQVTLIPYLVRDQYGLATEEGKLVAPPQYDQVTISRFTDVIGVKKDERWGFLSGEGKELLPPIMQFDSFKNVNGVVFYSPWISKAFNDGIQTLPFKETQLYRFENPSTHDAYFVNPNCPSISPESFHMLIEVRKPRDRSVGPLPGENGIIKIQTQKGKINFIDTCGNLILKKDAYNGIAINSNLFGIQRQDGRWALMNAQQKNLSGYIGNTIYAGNKIAIWGKDQFIRISRVKKDDLKKQYWFNAEGKNILVAKQLYIQALGGLIFFNEPAGAYLINQQGDTLQFFEGGELSVLPADAHSIQLKQNKLIGIVDSTGQLLTPVEFLAINKIYHQQFAFRDKTGGGIMDENFKILWRRDSITILERLWDKPSWYIMAHDHMGSRSVGIIDSLGHVVLPPDYTSLRYMKYPKGFLAKQNSLTGLLTDDFKIIVPLKKQSIEYEIESDLIFAKQDSIIRIYDINGVLKNVFPAIKNLKRNDEKVQRLWYEIPINPDSILFFNHYPFCTRSGLDESGKNYSALLDALGNELFRKPFDSLAVLENHSRILLYKHHDKMGIVNYYGQQLIPALYDSIWTLHGSNLILQDSNSTYWIKHWRPSLEVERLGNKGRVESIYMGGQYWGFSIQEKESGSNRLHVRILNERSAVIDEYFCNESSAFFNSTFLPEGYVALKDEAEQKPYLYNFLTRRKYQSGE